MCIPTRSAMRGQPPVRGPLKSGFFLGDHRVLGAIVEAFELPIELHIPASLYLYLVFMNAMSSGPCVCVHMIPYVCALYICLRYRAVVRSCFGKKR
jgi:hypothetical protein